MNYRAISRRIFVFALLGATFPAYPATAKVTVLNQQDLDRLIQINNAVQSLKQDVTTSLKSLPSYQVERVQSYAYLEVVLEAVQERLGSILMLVAVAINMETWNDQARILNVLYGELLPSARAYVNAKRTAIISIAGATAADNIYVAYSNRAASILGESALPMINEIYQRLASIHK